MTVRNALEALTRRPLDFLRSSWPWRSLAYLASSVVLCLPAVLVAAIAADSVVLAIATALATAALCAPLAARFELWRLRLIDLTPPQEATRERRRLLGLVSLVALWWIDLLMLGVTLGGPAVLMISPAVQPGELYETAPMTAVGVLLLPVAAYTVTAWAGARGTVTRALLVPRDTELNEVLRSRARLVDAFETERRRIERDLHDGAQQRLVALSMALGLARLDAPPELAVQLEKAHGEAKQALVELRELIRGVHSHVLTDRGLEAAVRDVAGRSPVPVTVDLPIDTRLQEAVEVSAFYAVSEALANIAKHSQATTASIEGQITRKELVIEVRDDGVGGADPAGGTGLVGLADRLSVVNGRLSVSSPAGGPTLVRVEIPCA
ncbi:sensor histidine kinase [Nonomuraea sp. NPDC050556]|uniref:sensor histidine kinase n=1 Tax=Nonomuraea sp. NPDC050556 TaxID=3364369 RepID=UPI0037B2E4E0